MKTLFIIVGLISFSSFAVLGKSMPTYTLVSDKVDMSIPKGSAIFVGNVATYDGYNIANALISTVDFTKHTVTDTAGNFRLILSEDDSAVFFFYFGYSEVVFNHDFKSQHVVTLKFHAQYNMAQISVDKPVIYCYSEKPISIDLALGFKSELTFSYPNYEVNGWQFEVNENGISYNNQSYPYLFWEGKTDHLSYNVKENNTIEGYIIDTDSTVSFLENTLTAYGLNQTEKTDFITYWGPRMVANDYALVQFQTGEAYAQNIASIAISPQPDAMLRLFMNFTPLTSDEIGGITTSPPTISTFEREGFTLLEWGGAEIPAHNLYLTLYNW